MNQCYWPKLFKITIQYLPVQLHRIWFFTLKIPIPFAPFLHSFFFSLFENFSNVRWYLLYLCMYTYCTYLPNCLYIQNLLVQYKEIALYIHRLFVMCMYTYPSLLCSMKCALIHSTYRSTITNKLWIQNFPLALIKFNFFFCKADLRYTHQQPSLGNQSKELCTSNNTWPSSRSNLKVFSLSSRFFFKFVFFLLLLLLSVLQNSTYLLYWPSEINGLLFRIHVQHCDEYNKPASMDLTVQN